MQSSYIPFEIHITSDDVVYNREKEFTDFCTANDAKPLFIELSKGNFIHQPMLSKIVYSNNFEDVLSSATKISESLSLNNFSARRMKIEIPAEHYYMFQNNNLSAIQYFEWHGKTAYIQTEALHQLCQYHKVHLSLNALKDSNNTRFITLREFGTIDEFKYRISRLTEDLHLEDRTIIKQQAEFCIYDNNNFLDTGWLPQ